MLITPGGGGTVLEPFAGSGTAGEGAMSLGFDVILIKQERDVYGGCANGSSGTRSTAMTVRPPMRSTGRTMRRHGPKHASTSI